MESQIFNAKKHRKVELWIDMGVYEENVISNWLNNVIKDEVKTKMERVVVI